MQRPNIVLINCDDLGYGDLGCYGSPVNQTPHLDRMAEEGIRFTDFYMASPVCSPSRAAMLTGCYPPRISFGEFDGNWVLFPGDPIGLNREEKSIAALLKDQGYATTLIGKWHCGDQPEFLPTRHGFDTYFGIPYSNDMGRQAGRERQDPLPLLEDESVIEQQPDQVGLTERYLEHAIRFMRANRERPFFLYLAHMYVHLPIYVQQRFLAQSTNGRYGGGVECVDWVTGCLLYELKQLGLDEDTIVIFTSDNGSRARGEGGSNAPLRGTKGTTWDGGQRVPCIVRWPSAIPAGRVSGALVSSIDLLPTLVGLAGGAVPRDRVIDGLDLASLWRGETDTSPRETFQYWLTNQLEALRDERWKLFDRRGEEAVLELYDLCADIGETTNVVSDHPEIVARLQAIMADARCELGDPATGIEGAGCRPAGRVEQPRPLCVYDPNYPYYMAEYDLGDVG